MEAAFLFITSKLSSYLPEYSIQFILIIILFLAFYLLAAFVFYFTKKVIIRSVGFVVEKSKNSLDNIFWTESFYRYIPHLAVSLVFMLLIKNTFLVEKFPFIQKWLEKIIIVYLSFVILFLLTTFLKNLLVFYEKLKLPDNFNLKGIYQAVVVFLYILTIIIALSALIEESPWRLLSGIGALTAVLILVFREPILGFVSGIQIFANKMAKIGDWIEIPPHNVDGNIIDITLTTIKVQNWDNTIVQIPTHKLTTDSFKNWEGMKESGGRRIKRSLFVDNKTVRFLTEKELSALKKNLVFKDYFSKKAKEASDFEISVNQQVMQERKITKKKASPTTLGVFREYTHHYLKNHPQIDERFTLMVRGLALTSKGMPIEIYCFTRTTDWVLYEGIQSEIFEHLVAVAKGFHLKIFQDPTGSDFQGLK